MGPIERAYGALGAALGAALLAAGMLDADSTLQVDPTDTLDDAADAAQADIEDGPRIWRWSALVQLSTASVRTVMGGPRARYVVERQVRLELGISGGDADQRAAIWAAAQAACAAVPGDQPTLGGAAERVRLTGAEPDDLPPSGLKTALTFVLRVRSGDPLGLTE